MRNFNNDSRFDNRRSNHRGSSNRSGGRYNRKSFNNRDNGQPSMYRAVCDECGRDCEVPFRPTGDKPIFCSRCFEDQGGGSQRRSEKQNFSRSNFEEKRMYRAVCDKCQKDCEVPFKPTQGKPIFCNDCFDKNDNPKNKNSEISKEQFEMLNIKLDRILHLLDPVIPTKKKETSAKDIDPKKVTLKKKTPSKKATPKKPVAKKKAVAKKKTVTKKITKANKTKK